MPGVEIGPGISIGGGIAISIEVPDPGNYITDELNDPLITEAGLNLITES